MIVFMVHFYLTCIEQFKIIRIDKLNYCCLVVVKYATWTSLRNRDLSRQNGLATNQTNLQNMKFGTGPNRNSLNIYQ